MIVNAWTKPFSYKVDMLRVWRENGFDLGNMFSESKRDVIIKAFSSSTTTTTLDEMCTQWDIFEVDDYFKKCDTATCICSKKCNTVNYLINRENKNIMIVDDCCMIYFGRKNVVEVVTTTTTTDNEDDGANDPQDGQNMYNNGYNDGIRITGYYHGYRAGAVETAEKNNTGTREHENTVDNEYVTGIYTDGYNKGYDDSYVATSTNDTAAMRHEEITKFIMDNLNKWKKVYGVDKWVGITHDDPTTPIFANSKFEVLRMLWGVKCDCVCSPLWQLEGYNDEEEDNNTTMTQKDENEDDEENCNCPDEDVYNYCLGTLAMVVFAVLYLYVFGHGCIKKLE